MKRLSQFLAALSLLGVSSAALAHTGHGMHGFGAGITHPFTGLDHLLAIFAVGLWAAQSHHSRGAIWALPGIFMLALVAGAGLAASGLTLVWAEPAIASSVLALGLLIALAVRVPTVLGILATAGFGLAHGYAHGLDMPTAASPLLYATGFLSATAILHLLGLTLGLVAKDRPGQWLRTTGGVIAAIGAGMLATL